MSPDPDLALQLGAVGDTVSARRAARGLLRKAAGRDQVLELLILTAACLQAELATSDWVTPADVTFILRSLKAEAAAGASFSASASAFVSYVGAELNEMAPDDLHDVLGRLIDDLSPAPPQPNQAAPRTE